MTPRPGTSRPILWLIGFLAFLNMYPIQAVLPLLMGDFHASATQAGAMVGATVLAVALAAPLVGVLSDALGRKEILFAALLLLTIPTAMIAHADRLDHIVLLRFLQGLAIPGVTVVLIAYIGEEFKGIGLVRAMTAYASGAVLGGFAGRFITGHLGELFGWRPAFLVLAGMNFVGALAVFRWLPASRNFKPHRDWRGTLSVLFRHLTNRRLIAAAMVGFCVLFSLIGSFTYVTLRLSNPPFGLSAGALANVFFIYLFGAVVTPFAGCLIHRLGYSMSIIMGLALSASGVMITLWPELIAIIIGLAASCSGVFLAQSASMSLLAASIQEGRSLGSGLYYTSYYAGGALGAWACGWAYVESGWTGVVAAVLTTLLAAMTLAWMGLRSPSS